MIKDYVNVSCAPEQRSAVELIDIVEISLPNDLLSDKQLTDPDT